jgi:hypothetical protein
MAQFDAYDQKPARLLVRRFGKEREVLYAPLDALNAEVRH